MEFKHLSLPEVFTLKSFVLRGSISQRHLPLGINGSVFWDSMGVWRDPKTDQFYPGSVDSLKAFSPTLRRNGIMFGVATNGPAIEGVDILKALEYPVPAAVAVTEGGGIVIHAFPIDGYLSTKMIASSEQIEKLGVLEGLAKRDPLMRALLEDPREEDAPPIRTPYGYENRENPNNNQLPTNIVLTLPPQFEILERRLADVGVDLTAVIPAFNPSKYVADVLNYAQGQFLDIMRKNPDLGIEEALQILIKEQNRRIYVSPKKTGLSGTGLSKSGGAHDSSLSPFKLAGAAVLRDAPEYTIEDSIYIADKALVTGKDGTLAINSSERTMIVTQKMFDAGPHRFANVLWTEPVYGLKPGVDPLYYSYLDKESTEILPYTVFAGVSCRLAVDITLDDSPPRMERVEGVPFLRIGSAHKAAEALTLLYEEVHGQAE